MTHIDKSRVTRSVSWHTYEWVMSYLCMSHGAYVIKSCHTRKRVMSNICISHVAHVDESWRRYEWDMSHIWLSHIAHIDVSCHTYERVMSHILTCHATHMNEAWRTWRIHAAHTGWRRLKGSPKLQIISHQRATQYRSLLRKINYKDKGSYESSPPCMDKSSRVAHINVSRHTYVWHEWHECSMAHVENSCCTYA